MSFKSTLIFLILLLEFLLFSNISLAQEFKPKTFKAPAASPAAAPPDDGGGGSGGGSGGGGGPSNTTPPPTPSTTFSTSYYCGSTRVKRNANPPSYVRWYWQTVSYGSSFSYGYGSTYTFNSTRHVYLRSYDTRTLKWGTSYKYAGYVRVNPDNLNAGNTSGAKTICYGASAGTLGNSSSASGGLSSYSYQWQVSSNNSSWSNISGATGKTYSPGNLTATRYYRRRVTSCGKTKYAASEKITVRGNLKAGSIGNAQTVCYNGNPSTLTNTASASGGATRTYRWQKSTTSSSSGFSNISGATGSTYNPPSLTKTTWYRRRVTSSSGCGTKYTNVIKVTVRSNLNAGSIGNAQTLCYNGNAATLSNTASASGAATRTYTWQSSTTSASGGFTDIGSTNSSTYNPPALTQTTWFRRKVTSSSGCGTKYTNAVKVTIHDNLQGGIINNTQTVCYNDDPDELGNSTSASGGTSLVYQWQQSVASSTQGFSDISGASGTTYNPSNLSETTWYRRMVTSGEGCGTQHSNTVQIIVHDELTPGAINGDNTVCYSSSGQVLGNVSAANGGNGSYSYQWQESIDGSDWSNVTGATEETYTLGSLAVSTHYRRAVTSCGATKYTSVVTVSVLPPLSAGTISGAQTVCFGSSPSLNGANEPTGGDDIYSFQWQTSTDNVNWTDIQSTNSSDYSPASLTASSYFRRKVVSCGLTAYSPSVLVTVNSDFDAGIIGGQKTICPDETGGTLTSLADASGGTGVFSYQWQESTDDLNWSNITGQNVSTLNVGSLNATKYYRRKVTDSQCDKFTSSIAINVDQSTANAGADLVVNNGEDAVALGGQPAGGIWQGDYVTGATFDAETAGIGEYRLTYQYTSPIGCYSEDERLITVHFNELTGTFTSRYVFQYKYDKYSRMIEKQVPGAGTVYMVYDNRDRLVLTQDGNQRVNNQWFFTKYDALNRPVLTGLYTDNTRTTRALMQTYVNDQLEQANFDWYETAGSAVHGYGNEAFPSVASADDYLTVTYYDDYDFIGAGHWAENVTISQPKAKTYVTGGKARVDLPDGTHDWNESITLYDSRYRVASTISQDYQGNKDTFVNEYYSLVHPLVVKTIHTHESAITSETTEITKEFDHDHADRLMKVTQTLDVTSDASFTAVTKVILENEYNELGELIKKKLNDEGGGVFSQEVDYQYNIRGWLTQINDPIAPDPEDYFAMQLKYDEAGQFNGNIGAKAWKNPFEEATNSYDYTYDPVNRLKSADYNTGEFSVPNIDYDANGNILALQRKGMTDEGTITDWDHLDYDYVGNQLTKVDDSGSTDLGFKDDASANTEYEYDANGNMISDANKGIEKIEYNHLNLPIRLEMNADGSDRIDYIYDAAGTKLAQIVYEDGTQTKRTDYQGAFIYESKGTDTSQLQFIQHEEGRIVYETDVNGDFVEYEYQYHLKDHLGNVRATFKEDGDIDPSFAAFEQDKQANEANYFTGYDGMVKITAELFNHTAGGNTSIRLNGSANEREGLSKSLKVKPGDVIDMEVYAKYFLQSESGGWTNAMNTMVSNIASNAGGIVVDGGGIGADANPFVDWSGKANPTSAPEAYLNYMVFDEYYNLISELTGHQQISELAKETGINVTEENPTGEDHEKLEHSITITQTGYVYIYLSNEEDTPIDVFFDDFTVTQHHTPIVSKDDYYPFGLTFGGYSRPASVGQRFKYNGKELQDDLDFNVLDYGARMYMPELGRFFTQDRFSEKYNDFSPYQYAANNPIKYIDVNGDSLWIQIDKNNKALYQDGNLTNADGTAYTGKGTKVDKNGNRKNTGFLKTAVNNLNRISGGKEGNKLVDGLQSSQYNVTVTKATAGNGNSFDPATSTVNFDPSSLTGDLNSDGNKARDPYIGLAHELGHADDNISSGIDRTPVDNTIQGEIYAAHMENLVRAENGEALRVRYRSAKGVTRLLYNGTSIHNGHDYLNRTTINRVQPKTLPQNGIKPIKIGF
ncbi:RHS repeat-associated core domain-containing protein [Reichenbachiella sp.]|uniref:RHS repeat-associated core domain-containing protein n=1 Tax=Reichenbachiella sp. TaxID=2184521 RepID=UPI003BB0D2B8